MKWSAWKQGMFVAVGTGLLTALSGNITGIPLKQLWPIFLTCVLKDAILYMKEHPLDQVTENGGPGSSSSCGCSGS